MAFLQDFQFQRSLYEKCKQQTRRVTVEELNRIETLRSCLLRCYTNKEYTDCVLKVGDVQFPALKLILSIRSCIFAAIFEHDPAAKLSGVVVIHDVEAAIVDEFLQFIYSAKFPKLNTDTAVSMCELADKYAVFDLEDFCLNFLKDNIIIENVCDVAVLAHTQRDTELEDKVVQFIENGMEDIQQSNAYMDLPKPVQMLLFQMETARREKTLADLTLVSGENSYLIHSQLLGIRCPELVPAIREAQLELCIPLYTHACIEKCLNFIYTTNITFDMSTCFEMIRLATYLGSHELVSLCENYILNSLSVTNICNFIVEIYTHAPHLIKHVCSYIAQNYREIHTSVQWAEFSISRPDIAIQVNHEIIVSMRKIINST